MQPDALTRSFRQANVALRARTVHDMRLLWPALHWDRLEKTFPGWLRAVALVIERDRQVSAGLAASYLPAYRIAVGVPGLAQVKLADPAPIAQVMTAMLATTIAPLKDAAKRGTPAEQAMQKAFVLSSGAASRLALNGGRDTIFATGQADSATVGWFRETSGDPCAFCAMLAGRGGVYYSEDTAGFEAHDHCSCMPAPMYDAAYRAA